MPRWDRQLRIVLDWTVALFFRPVLTFLGGVVVDSFVCGPSDFV
jgi:hypothetical protein